MSRYRDMPRIHMRPMSDNFDASGIPILDPKNTTTNLKYFLNSIEIRCTHVVPNQASIWQYTVVDTIVGRTYGSLPFRYWRSDLRYRMSHSIFKNFDVVYTFDIGYDMCTRYRHMLFRYRGFKTSISVTLNYYYYWILTFDIEGCHLRYPNTSISNVDTENAKRRYQRSI